ncbi:ABC transporter permease [Halostagnicola bangensis]
MKESPTEAVVDSTTGRQVSAFVVRTIREIRRNRAALFWCLVFPSAFFAFNLFVFVNIESVESGNRAPVIGSVAITFGVLGILFVALYVFSQQFVGDLERGHYLKFRTTSLTPSADLGGRLLASIIVAFGSFGVVLVFAVLLGGEYQLRSYISILVVIGTIVSLTVVWVVIGMGIATLISDPRTVTVVSISLALGAFFLTGFNGGNPQFFAPDPAWLDIFPNSLSARILLYHMIAIPPDQMPEPGVPGTVEHLLMAGYGIGSFGIGLLLVNRFHRTNQR